MGLFRKDKSKPDKTETSDPPSEKMDRKSINLAFVLLSEAKLPSVEEVIKAFRDFAAPGEKLKKEEDNPTKTASGQIFTLNFNTGERSFIMLMPVAVPKGEADDGFRFSLSSFTSNWKNPPHCAHLVVTFHGLEDSSPLVQVSRFTALVAAVTQVSRSVGVYWGGAGATHDARFFTSLAADREVFPRIMLWSGLSIGEEKDGRHGILSMGMRQLGLPDILLIADKTSQGEAIETMYDFLGYITERGEAIREGDTVGRSADEKLPVHYVPSPMDPSIKVWRVEFP